MKSVIIHGLFAIVGLVAAYQTWTRDETADEPVGEAVLVDCLPQQVARVQLETAMRRTLIERREQTGAAIYWGTTARKVEDQLKDPRVFLAGKAFDDFLRQMVPVRAVRALGNLPADQLEKFELHESSSTLTVECAGRSHEIELGGSTYGQGNRYARRRGGDEVFVLPADLTRHLDAAEYRFKQKQLHDFELSDVDEARVHAQGTSLSLVHRNYRDPRQAMWVSADAPDRRNALFDNWFERLGKMIALEYLGLDEPPGTNLGEAASEASPVFRIEYFRTKKPLGSLEVVRVDAKGKPNYYGRSEATRGWVTLPAVTAKQVSREVGLVVGLEELEQEADGAETAEAASEIEAPAEH